MFPGFSRNPCRFLLRFQAPRHIWLPGNKVYRRRNGDYGGRLEKRRPATARRHSREKRCQAKARPEMIYIWLFPCDCQPSGGMFCLRPAAPWMDKYKETPIAEEPHLPLHTRTLPEEVQQMWQQQQLHRSEAGWWQKRSMAEWLHEFYHRRVRKVHELLRKDEGRA